MAQSEYEINPGKESDEMIKRVNKLVLGISFLFLIISIVAGCGTGKKRK